MTCLFALGQVYERCKLAEQNLNGTSYHNNLEQGAAIYRLYKPRPPVL